MTFVATSANTDELHEEIPEGNVNLNVVCLHRNDANALLECPEAFQAAKSASTS